MSYTRGVSRTHWVSCTRTDRVSCTRTHRASCTRTAFHSRTVCRTRAAFHARIECRARTAFHARTGRRAHPHATALHTHAPRLACTHSASHFMHTYSTRTISRTRVVHNTRACTHAIAMQITPGQDVMRDVTLSPRYLWKKTSLAFLLLKKDTNNTPETCNAAKKV